MFYKLLYTFCKQDGRHAIEPVINSSFKFIISVTAIFTQKSSNLGNKWQSLGVKSGL